MLDLANRKSSAKNRGVPGVHLELRRRPVHLAARSAENLELDSIFCISVNHLRGICRDVSQGSAGAWLVCRVFGATFNGLIKNIIDLLIGRFNQTSISVSACG